jgi:hypothetical protein
MAFRVGIKQYSTVVALSCPVENAYQKICLNLAYCGVLLALDWKLRFGWVWSLKIGVTPNQSLRLEVTFGSTSTGAIKGLNLNSFY